MIYCTKCLYPNTKPDLIFNEAGVCSACIAFEARKNINWEKRENQFKNLVVIAKDTGRNSPYDCIIPVSGGKDSHYQVIKALEYGLRPLAVTAQTDDLSDLGWRNLSNISRLGVDHIMVSTNAKLRRKINKYTLETIGDISWAEHVTIFTVPIRESIIRNIPLIIWGENPQNEYGGPNEKAQEVTELDSNWLGEFGGLNGLRVQDIIDAGMATKKDMCQYTMPYLSLDNPPRGIFLGQFFDWDGKKNADIALQNGFEFYRVPVEGCGVNYENLDNHQTGIHDRFKYLKFGFGRATDIACNWIRRGYMTRERGVEFVKQYDNTVPHTYLGKDLYDILSPLGLSVDEYVRIEEKFANPELFDIKYNVLHDANIVVPKFEVR